MRLPYARLSTMDLDTVYLTSPLDSSSEVFSVAPFSFLSLLTSKRPHSQGGSLTDFPGSTLVSVCLQPHQTAHSGQHALHYTNVHRNL